MPPLSSPGRFPGFELVAGVQLEQGDNHVLFGRKAAWDEARKGRLPTYHVLNRCELPGHDRDFQLVDFSRVFTIAVGLTRDLAESQGTRLRLNPPYREHLAQAFARFFMRVGLPVDIPPFSK